MALWFPICALGHPILTSSGARGWERAGHREVARGTVLAPGVTFVAVRSSYSYAAPDQSVATLVFDLGSLIYGDALQWSYCRHSVYSPPRDISAGT